jgi:hypothetical protein
MESETRSEGPQQKHTLGWLLDRLLRLFLSQHRTLHDRVFEERLSIRKIQVCDLRCIFTELCRPEKKKKKIAKRKGKSRNVVNFLVLLRTRVWDDRILLWT